MAVRRSYASEVLEAAARVGRLRHILQPDLEFRVFSHTAKVLAGKWTIPCYLDFRLVYARSRSQRTSGSYIANFRVMSSPCVCQLPLTISLIPHFHSMIG